VHEADLTHRDLKPANVVITANGARVSDFATARALGSAGMTRTGVADVPGLPAPEQVTGGSIAAASDVFALGGVLCHAVGVAPFGDGTASETAQKVVREMPDLAELPDWLREIVADCLKKRPTVRPSAADLVDRFAAEEDGDWLPASVAALLAAGTEGADEDEADEDDEPKAEAKAKAEPVAADANEASDEDEDEDKNKNEDQNEDEDEPETTEVPAMAVPDESPDDDVTEPVAAVAPDVDGPEAAAEPAAKSPAASGDSDETPVSTPAVDVAKKPTKPASRPIDPAADDDATTVTPPKPAYDGAAPVVVPAVQRRESPAPPTPPVPPAPPAPPSAPSRPRLIADAPTEVVPPGGTPFTPADAGRTPQGTVPADSSAQPVPPGVGASEPREPKPANPLIWYAVIALLGLTAAGLGLYRLTDSAWRDAQNTMFGLVLPGLSVVADLAGLAVLGLVLVSARKPAAPAAPAAPGPYDDLRVGEPAHVPTDSLRG